MKTRLCNQKGYTLIEIIIVIIVLGIIGGITFHVLAAGMETYLVARERQELYNEARLALERMVRELRDGNQIVTPAPGAAPATSINFIRSHVLPNDASTDITFQLAGTNLRRVGDISGTDVLASNLVAVTGFQVTHEAKSLVMVTDDGGMNDGGGDWDATKANIFGTFGYTVTAIDDNDAPAIFTTAAANNDVMFISESVTSGNVGFKATDLNIGIVNEEQALIDELEHVNVQNTGSVSGTTINIVNNGLYISSLLSLGNLTVFTANDAVWYTQATLSPGTDTLATQPSTGNPGFLVLDRGELRDDGNPSPHRRVSPFFMHESLPALWTQAMRDLLKRSLDWAAGRLPGNYVTLELTLTSAIGGTINLRTRVYVRNIQP
jgi:prepilin-type N-terminal cleavage/methylation domain-containing protein